MKYSITTMYQRFITVGFKPFNPLELAQETEKIVTREGNDGLERKYVSVYSAPVYGGIATGYAVGCCLRCIYCWTNWSRDFPENFGRFYSPGELAEALLRTAEQGITAPGWERFRHLKVKKLRISGCEPTLGRRHLIKLLEYISGTGYPFYLETNGILIGAEPDYAEELSKFKQFIYVRVSFKAATPEGFTARTGAIGEFYELPFKALENLLKKGIFARAAAMTDSKVMPEKEREILIKRLTEIDPKARYSETLEEEIIDPYDTTIQRLKAYTDSEYATLLEKEILKDRTC
ncbi:MAG: radical SAM protein [candidate division WOR-3 bacterium]|nr:radical SAM protein [candidate division WOR-3 bacterium]